MIEILTFFGGAVIGGLISWLITHRYYVKASDDQAKQLETLASNLSPKNTLQDFGHLLDTSSWKKEFIDGTEIWMCGTDHTYQIQRGDRSREFRERWTDVYPDVNSSAYPVYLKIGNSIVKELTFISMDGGRIFVPMPDIRTIDDDAESVEYFWNMNSLEIKVCGVVGKYYIYENVHGVARRSRIGTVE